MASKIETEVNDLLKFVFSDPETPGKKLMRKSLQADWRPVIAGHCNLTVVQKKWIANLTDAEAKQIASAVTAAAGQGTPRVKFIDNKTGSFTVQRAKNDVNNNKNNNVNGATRVP